MKFRVGLIQGKDKRKDGNKMNNAEFYRQRHIQKEIERKEVKAETKQFLLDGLGFLLGAIGVLMFVFSIGLLGGAI